MSTVVGLSSEMGRMLGRCGSDLRIATNEGTPSARWLDRFVPERIGLRLICGN